jgi:uncharacterized membrane protein
MVKEAAQSGPGSAFRGRIAGDLEKLFAMATERAVSSLTGKIGSATTRLTEYAEQGGGPGLVAAVTGARKAAGGSSPIASTLSAGFAGAKEKAKEALGGGGDGKRRDLKVTNIVEQIDIGLPVSAVYNQWTRFTDFPSYMKKVENVEQESDETLNWKAQVFWSHRSWQSTILDQVPDKHIVWQSKGEKGSVDGAVTFHELGPELTRVMLILEYHPQGLFERTGNIWRAQGRRARLELKHFARHAMTDTLLHPDEVEGWRGEIHDSQVVEGSADEDETDEADQTDVADEADETDETDEAELRAESEETPRRQTRGSRAPEQAREQRPRRQPNDDEDREDDARTPERASARKAARRPGRAA